MFRRRLTVLAATLAVTGIGLAQPASAAESWVIPPTATITFDGHGFGHGRGLSQYGAEHAALQGVGYRDIVDYYYPGTAWGTATGAVRIWITQDLTNDVQVASQRGLIARKIGATGAWDLTKLKKKATRWRIMPAGDTASTLQFFTKGWHISKRVSGSLEFAAPGKAIRLYIDGGSVDYRGVLRSVPSPSTPGNRLTINVLPMDTYLRGVVPAESVASAWQQDTLRAQAVAARSYAAFQRAARQTKVYDLCETDTCQVYGGASAEYPTTNTAVKATAGEILTYGGAPAFTEFSASSGGWTAEGDYPYLPAMVDKYQPTDDLEDPNYDWTVPFSDAEIEQAYPSIGDLTGIEFTGRDGNGEWGGRVGTVILTGDEGSVSPTGSAFRQKLRLRSEWFTITVS